MNKLFWLIVFAGIAVAAFSAGSVEKQIDIYYTSSLNGNLDGCECKGNPRSGLVKRAVFLREIDRNKSLLLEAGDIFDVYEDKLLSEYILESYQDLGYDAIAIGDQEFSNGSIFLIEKIHKNLFLNNNLSIRNNGGIFKQISDKPLIISRQGINITVLSAIDPEVFRFYPEKLINSIKIEDPAYTIQEFFRNPEVEDVDLRVLLFHGSIKIARELASTIPALDIIIVGHEQQIADGEMIGNTVIVSPGGEGNMLGHLKVLFDNSGLNFHNNFISFDYMNDPDDEIIRVRIDEYTQIMKERLNGLSVPIPPGND